MAPGRTTETEDSGVAIRCDGFVGAERKVRVLFVAVCGVGGFSRFLVDWDFNAKVISEQEGGYATVGIELGVGRERVEGKGGEGGAFQEALCFRESDRVFEGWVKVDGEGTRGIG